MELKDTVVKLFKEYCPDLENPFNGIESILRAEAAVQPRVYWNPFNGIERRKLFGPGGELPNTLWNPFNGIESLEHCCSPTADVLRWNPFNGIESYRRGENEGVFAKGLRIHSMELKG